MAKIIKMYFNGLICLEDACDGMRDLITDKYISADITGEEAVRYFGVIEKWGNQPTLELEVA